MRRLFLMMIIVACANIVVAQKSDYTWVTGYQSNYHNINDSIAHGFTTGNIKLDFNQNPVNISFDSIAMNFDFTEMSYSDSDGNLLFYSNGIYLANSLSLPIENGDSLNVGYLDTVWDPTIATYGYRCEQGLLGLQSVTNPNQYYLVSSYVDTMRGTNASSLYCAKILVALIDMSLNGGLGQVISKNQTIIQDNIGEEIQGVRHGDGRDWWILIQKRNSNCFYRILLDTSGIHVLPELTCEGDTITYGQVSAGCFTPDGTKYAYIGTSSGLNIYDFDRCTGLLGNPRHLPLPILTDSNWIGVGLAISPNSRFLYASLTHQLYQFDLLSDDIFSSIDTVGIYAGGHMPNTPQVESIFHIQQLAPNGKIYMSGGNTVPYYQVINNPDEKGVLCNFVQDGVDLPCLTDGIPNFPNYRLGSLTQSQCDSLTTFTQDVRDAKEKILKVFPNPATDATTVDYGFTDWNKGPISLEITDALGQVVYTQPLPMYSGFQSINIGNIATGIYHVAIKRNTATVAVAKLVKQ